MLFEQKFLNERKEILKMRVKENDRKSVIESECKEKCVQEKELLNLWQF